MQEFINFLLESSTLAFVVSLVIFIITLWLVVKRSIGFFITVLLLIFALVSGFFVANQDLLRGFLKSFSKDGVKDSSTDSYALFKQQLERSYQELKDDFSQQKKEFEELFQKLRMQNPPPADSVTDKEEKK